MLLPEMMQTCLAQERDTLKISVNMEILYPNTAIWVIFFMDMKD